MNVKRPDPMFTSILISILLVTVLMLLLSPPIISRTQAMPLLAVRGTVRYVASDGICGGATPCYPNVQAAVDNADSGDEIRVASGTYTDISLRPRADVTTTGVVTQIVYISKTITIRGGYTTSDWTISAPDVNLTTLDARRNVSIGYGHRNREFSVETLGLE